MMTMTREELHIKMRAVRYRSYLRRAHNYSYHLQRWQFNQWLTTKKLTHELKWVKK